MSRFVPCFFNLMFLTRRKAKYSYAYASVCHWLIEWSRVARHCWKKCSLLREPGNE